MSHIVKIETKITDRATLYDSLIQNPDVEWHREGEFSLYSSTATGYGIKLKSWRYPIVVQRDGTVSYDNYGGQWGDIKYFKKVVQNYAVEKTKREASRRGQYVKTKVLSDGSVKLTLQGGASW